MNNIEERINSLEMELAELKKLVKEENKIWEPKENEKYYTITMLFNMVEEYHNNNAGFDLCAIDCANYFKTEEEAKKQAEYNRVMNRFRKYVEAYSKPLDWSNYDQKKWYIYYGGSKTIQIDNIFNRDAFQIYASSEQILKDAIIYSAGSEKEFKRIVFGVEE